LSTNAAVPQTFQFQAEPAGNDSTSPSGTLNLLYGPGTATPGETGLKISNKGLITFAAGQTFPTVTRNETVTGNVTASELISTIATGAAPLKVTSTTQVANLNASLLGGMPASAFATLGSNSFSGSQGITGGLNVFSPTNPGGPISYFGSNGATDSDSIQIYTNKCAYLAETFVAGCSGCFVPGAQTGDGGMRVAAGQNLVLGDPGLNRLNLDSAGNASQQRTAGGLVKAMFLVDGVGIGHCFNSMLYGASATQSPCGFAYFRWGPGDYTVDLGFQVNDRIISATAGGSSGSWNAPEGEISVTACVLGLEGFPCKNTIRETEVEITSFCANINTCGHTSTMLFT
jgi:hypothetical protein